MMSAKGYQTTQYDALATAYDLLWQVPAVKPLFPLLTSTIQSMGSFENASVLDLACGTGIGLRILRSFGASKLVGVDISPQMLEIAKTTVRGVTLHTADCSKPLDHLGLEPASFDIVLGFWLLNYCPSSGELQGMWANISKYLKPGGKFVGIIENHDIAHPDSMKTMKYGAMMSNIKDLQNGHGWSVHVTFDTQPKIEFDAFRLRAEVVEREASKAGLGDIEYSKPGWDDIKQVISENIGEKEGEVETWWSELVEAPPNYVIVTQKQSSQW